MKNINNKKKEFNLDEYKKNIGYTKEYEEDLRMKHEEWLNMYRMEKLKFRLLENYVLDLTKIYNMD